MPSCFHQSPLFCKSITLKEVIFDACRASMITTPSFCRSRPESDKFSVLIGGFFEKILVKSFIMASFDFWSDYFIPLTYKSRMFSACSPILSSIPASNSAALKLKLSDSRVFEQHWASHSRNLFITTGSVAPRRNAKLILVMGLSPSSRSLRLCMDSSDQIVRVSDDSKTVSLS